MEPGIAVVASVSNDLMDVIGLHSVDAVGSDEDLMDVEVHHEDDDAIIAPPVIYSWGRSDTNTLLRSPNEVPSVDGVQAVTFANQRTIVQVN